LVHGQAFISTTVMDRWADWPMLLSGIKVNKDRSAVTLEMKRSEEEGTFWIFRVESEQRVPFREVM